MTVPPRGGSGRDHARLGDYARLLEETLQCPHADAPRIPLDACSRADAALAVFRRTASCDMLPGVSGRDLLSERAAWLGLAPPTHVSANGTCRLYPSRHGPIALNLARPEDEELLPAWLEAHPASLEERLAEDAGELVARGRLMGLPVARLGEVSATSWYQCLSAPHHPPPHTCGAPSESPQPINKQNPPVVLDLSALWAGPLAGHLLERAGMRVIKVESTTRPDTTRTASPDFFNVLNANKQSVVLDFTDLRDRGRLRRLCRSADIVLESSRPRALRQLGIDAERLVAEIPGLTWVSITGYGRSSPERDWVAFGDDAAIAGGIKGAGLQFLGDAIADPLTGLHAALAALGQWRKGGGMVALSLAAVAAFCRGETSQQDPLEHAATRPAAGTAATFGADTKDVLREFACS